MDDDDLKGRVKGEKARKKRSKLKPKLKRKRKVYCSQYIGKEVLLKEKANNPFFCKIISLGEEADQAVYEVEANNEVFSVFASSVDWIRLRSQVKIMELNNLNLEPMRIITGFH